MNQSFRAMLVCTLPIALSLAVSGCKKSGSHGDLDSLDKELTDANGVGRDPAITASLRDQITVDPALAQSSNARAVRPPSRPDPHAMPPEQLGAPADTSTAQQLRATPPATGECRDCAAAKRSLTLGALAEAGSNAGAAGCAGDIRYASNAPLSRVLDWYYGHATRGGYSATHQADGAEHVLMGARGDAAYAVYLSPHAGGGTAVDLVSNGG